MYRRARRHTVAVIFAVCAAHTAAAPAETPPPEVYRIVARFLGAASDDLRIQLTTRWQPWAIDKSMPGYEVTYPSADGTTITVAVWVGVSFGVVTRAVWPPTASKGTSQDSRLAVEDLRRLAEEFLQKHPPVADASLLLGLETALAERSPAGDRPADVYHFRFVTTRTADGVQFARQIVVLDAADGRVMQYGLLRIHVECFDKAQVTREAAVEIARAELDACAPPGTQWDLDVAQLVAAWPPTIKPGDAPVWLIRFRQKRPGEDVASGGYWTFGIHAVDGSVIGAYPPR